MLRDGTAAAGAGDDVPHDVGPDQGAEAGVPAVVEMNGLHPKHSRAVAPEAGGREETGRMAGRGRAGNDGGEGFLSGGTLP